MPDLMDDRRPDFIPDLVFRRSVPLKRFLKDQDDVGRIVAVIRAALIVRDSMIQPEQMPGGGESHIGYDLRRRKVFDQDRDVLDPAPEILGEAVHRFRDQLFELLPG